MSPMPDPPTTMNGSDAVMWTIERDPQLRSTITAIALLDRRPDRDGVRKRVEQAVTTIPKLHQRVVQPAVGFGRPRWVDDPATDLEYHLRTVAAPESAGAHWLFDFAGHLAESGFDRSRPLWEFVVVEGLPDGRAALVQKVHHSLTDGVGGMELMVGLLDRSRAARPRRVAAPSLRAVPTRVAPTAPPPLEAAPPAGGRPSTGPAGPPWARAWQTAGSLGRFLAPGGPRLSPVFRDHSIRWRFDTLEVPLDGMRRAGAAAHGTINDAFLAAVAGGLHRYHLEHGHDVAELKITLPVSLRRQTDADGGNRFTPVRFRIPIAEPDPVQRIGQLGELARRWRNEPALDFSESVALMLDLLHPAVTTAVMSSMLKGIDFVATNVPGIPFRCYLAGAEVLREYGFAPLSGAAVNISLVSHAGTACIGINSDRAAVVDPERFVACLASGFDEITSLARRHRRAAS